MEPDFSGIATKANLKCADGRTIMKDAFAHQDGTKVPLVWQHSHNTPTNVLGHVILHSVDGDMRADAYINKGTPQGLAAAALVQHGDVDSLSIWANQLTEKVLSGAKQVFHGAIKEVSLVLSGANPGAKIDFVRVAHSDDPDDFTDLDDTAVITMGLPLFHSDTDADSADEDEPEETEEDEALEHADGGEKTIQDVYNGFTKEQKDVVHYMIGSAIEAVKADTAAEHSDTNNTSDEDVLAHQEGNNDMKHNNIFEQDADNAGSDNKLSHAQISTIMKDGERMGSLKDSFIAHAEEYGIEDIDFLFPDAKSITSTPQLLARRMEWVQVVLDGTKHSPISRIKSVVADITAEEARAKGYVKGNKKKDEIIKLLKRVTTPTTIYKKQKLDRDDIVDITDFDVVVWIKGEMRLMLDEEVARAILIGDGREPDDEDKVNEDHVRPIAYDDDMYAHKINLASNVSPQDLEEAILRSRTYYRGTGTPTAFMTDEVLTDLLLQKDKMGRRIYSDEAALASALRVAKVVPVEAMQNNPDLLVIIVSLTDYTVGADRGGEVNMFDDFDIDFNQQKYLIETRISGALTKPKSAIVISRDAGTLVTPQTPSFDGETNTITVPNQAGVVYKINGVTQTAGPVVIDETTDVEAFPATGYAFPHNINTDWTYVYSA